MPHPHRKPSPKSDRHQDHSPYPDRKPSLSLDRDPSADRTPDRSLDPRPAPSPVVAVLTGALAWRLSPEGWEAVGHALEELAAAGGRPDSPAGQRALAALLAASPGRVLRAGAGAAAPGLPAPPRIRERVNHLVHELTTAPAPERSPQGGTGTEPPAGRRDGADGGRVE